MCTQSYSRCGRHWHRRSSKFTWRAAESYEGLIRGLRSIRFCRIWPAVKSFNPSDKLAAAWVAIVNHQPWSMPLDLGEGQLYRLGVEFRIIQTRQLAEPTKAPTASEKARTPIRHSDTHYTLATACVENNGV